LDREDAASPSVLDLSRHPAFGSTVGKRRHRVLCAVGLKFGEAVARIKGVFGLTAHRQTTHEKESPMFSSARRISLYSEHRLYTPPSPPSAGRRRAIGALRAVLTVAVVSLSVFTLGRIFLAGAPLTGARDLLTLYGATAALALGLAGLFELKASESDSKDASGRAGRGGLSTRASGIFRRTRDEGFRFLSKALSMARAG